jgi:hypothetical protein
MVMFGVMKGEGVDDGVAAGVDDANDDAACDDVAIGARWACCAWALGDGAT